MLFINQLHLINYGTKLLGLTGQENGNRKVFIL